MTERELPPSTAELLSELPGGKHIAPHYFDGPWHFVGVTFGLANRRAAAIFDAHPPIATFTYCDEGCDYTQDVTVYALPHFAAQLLRWEVDEVSYGIPEGLDLLGEFTTEPALIDLVLALAEYEDLDETLVARLATVDPVSFLRVYSELVPGRANKELEPAELFTAVLDALK